MSQANRVDCVLCMSSPCKCTLEELAEYKAYVDAMADEDEWTNDWINDDGSDSYINR